MKIVSQRVALIVAGVLALSAAGCGGDSGPQGPSGGYDDNGFPLDERGNVSSDPEDYRQAVCNAVGDEAVDYQEECE